MRKAVLGLTKVAFIERWPSYSVATIDKSHCISDLHYSGVKAAVSYYNFS